MDDTNERLAERLGDTPETVIAVHRLRRGSCRVFVAGPPDSFRALVLQLDECPDEPAAWGEARAVWGLLQGVEGWGCVNIDAPTGEELARIIESETGRSCRLHGDVYHTLPRPAAVFDDPAVRRLRPEDAALLHAAPEELRGAGFGTIEALLAEGVVAGAVADGQLVAIAHTSAISERHTDLGVVTHEDHRKRGYSTAAASLVAREALALGKVPVWSCGEDNWASLRVAEKLGFVEVSRRGYVIPSG